jgi:transposase InsO family protein
VPDYLIRDRDRVYGEAFTRRIRAMGIRDRPTTPRWPWQNGHAERLIGSIRRECLDHVIVFGAASASNPSRIRALLQRCPNAPFIGKDSLETRSVQVVGSILPLPVLGGLHHHYVRI